MQFSLWHWILINAIFIRVIFCVPDLRDYLFRFWQNKKLKWSFQLLSISMVPPLLLSAFIGGSIFIFPNTHNALWGAILIVLTFFNFAITPIGVIHAARKELPEGRTEVQAGRMGKVKEIKGAQVIFYERQETTESDFGVLVIIGGLGSHAERLKEPIGIVKEFEKRFSCVVVVRLKGGPTWDNFSTPKEALKWSYAPTAETAKELNRVLTEELDIDPEKKNLVAAHSRGSHVLMHCPVFQGEKWVTAGLHPPLGLPGYLRLCGFLLRSAEIKEVHYIGTKIHNEHRNGNPPFDWIFQARGWDLVIRRFHSNSSNVIDISPLTVHTTAFTNPRSAMWRYILNNLDHIMSPRN